MMRSPLRITAALMVGLLLPAAAAPSRSMAQEADLSGNWKLVVLMPLQELELGLVEVSKTGEGYGGKLLGSIFPPNAINFDKIEAKGDRVSLVLKGGPMGEPFVGTIDKSGKALGSIKIQNSVYPARLEKTGAKELAQPNQGAPPLAAKLTAAMRERDPKAKLDQLQEILKQETNIGTTGLLYPEAIKAAAATGADRKAIAEMVEKYVASSQPYGKALADEAQLKAATALGDKADYAPLALELARKVEKRLDESASTELKANIYGTIASSAKAAGDAKAAEEATAMVEKLNTKLDSEYHEKVPPFKPETYAGRKNTSNKRVALMELFTGAECPPCVAADVGFDGLAKTYKPTDVILLQYHLHIPGPDPLTNKETQDRAKYYPELRGTPSTFFDGKSAAGGGGGMAGSEGKYQEYRKLLDEAIEKAPKADLDLKADLKDGAIHIVANAATDSKSSKVKLRLALVEDSVRYPGGNGLRFHHKVVRGMPGGVEGVAVADGKAKVDMTVKLADLKAALESTNAEFQKGQGFPHPLPPIDLKGLSVVAFVQDDADKSVLQAACVPLDAAEAH
ncbi:MAG: hypothetical protein U0800_02305 [Isosphaeraceae bacterium]